MKNTIPTQNTVLILQGGGALGAYQAGVYQQLHEQDTSIQWVIGTSIGAINAALIAGNPPEKRITNLRAFWRDVATTEDPAHRFWKNMMPWLPAFHTDQTFNTILHGVDGFFKPRYGATMDATVPLSEMAFYDTAPLKVTLEKYVDFDYLNNGPMRLSVCAVDVESCSGMVFDSNTCTIRAEHIMASGALPPAFPPVEIDGRAYWDGGIFSNSPLEVYLAESKTRNGLCFLVDLWDPSEELPQSIAQAMTRYKSIQYASRSHEQLVINEKVQELRKAIRQLADALPEATRHSPEMKSLIDMGRDHTISVVQLVMKALPGENYSRDIDFSQITLDNRWEAGITDAKRALRHKAWLKPLPPHAGLVIHEVPQEDNVAAITL